MMKKTALVVMAAGIGSRYGGGIKQMDPLGPAGEIMMDYSIHDALEAGFDKVVFIIRKDLDRDFRRLIGNRVEKKAEVRYAYQELGALPAGFSVPEGRVKPWGTGQAILAAKEVIEEPFCVVNADDYYGKQGFRALHDALVKGEDGGPEGKQRILMAGFVLKNTLSEHGGVTRGLVSINAAGHLTGIRETRNIIRVPGGAAVEGAEGRVSLDPDSLVSMNMWGLYPSFLELLEDGFKAFLAETGGDPLKREYLLPEIIDGLVAAGRADVEVLKSEDSWFGVTYKEDKAAVRAALARLVRRGIYRTPLF